MSRPRCQGLWQIKAEPVRLSAVSSDAVMKLLSDEVRKAAAAATSDGLQRCHRGKDLLAFFAQRGLGKFGRRGAGRKGVYLQPLRANARASSLPTGPKQMMACVVDFFSLRARVRGVRREVPLKTNFSDRADTYCR